MAAAGLRQAGHQAGPQPAGKARRAGERSRGFSGLSGVSSWSSLPRTRAARIADLAELNRLFTAWTETVYHVREHSETGQPPLARWEAGGPFPLPADADLAEAFRWSEWRTVSKTAPVSLHGNRYQVDPALAGRRVELVFDPFDLTVLCGAVAAGKDAGTATPHHITRHSHPKARPEPLPGDDAPRATGIDYLALLGEQHDRQAARRVNYAALASPARPPRRQQDSRGSEQEQARRTPVDDFRQIIDLDEAHQRRHARLARTAAEAIRGLNWLTRCDAGLGQPSVAYDVLGALSLAASRLGQLLTQITR